MISALLFFFIVSIPPANFYSLRIQGIGKELAGIITDEETDAYLYPARIVKYSSYIGSIYSANGIGSFFFIPRPIMMGGIGDFDCQSSISIEGEYDRDLFGDVVFPFALPLGKSFSLGICPRVEREDRQDQDHVGNWRDERFHERSFGVSPSLSFFSEKLEVDGSIMITFSNAWDTLYYKYPEEDSSYSRSNFFHLLPNLRITLKRGDIAIKFIHISEYYIDEHELDTPLESKVSGFSLLPKFGIEWSKEGMSVGAAIASHYQRRNYKDRSYSNFSISFPFGIEYPLKPFILRLGLGVEYEYFPNHFNEYYIRKYYSIGFGFAPLIWLSINFVPDPYERLWELHYWESGIKIKF